ncbi:hypothetical protein [Agromyces sp. GXQ0307]|uniref:hypothetical protein n=1 Tax=Agromyces sp. GXQ0307 TaxID=3377835 RepID=UPI00383A15ED
MTNDLATHLRKQLVRSLVQRAITCPLTGAVLDVHTVAVVNDADGDPAIVLSPEGAEAIKNDPTRIAALDARGYHFAA